MTAAAPAGTGTIDTDVHCAPASLADLTPYFEPYWRTYVLEGGVSLSATQGLAYPPQAPTTATPEAREAGLTPARTVGDLRAHVLDPQGLRAALLTCTASFACNRNPYYEAALTRAVNDWMITEWLDADDRLRAGMVVPTLDTEAAVAEIERIGDDPRVVQVLLPTRTDAPWGNKRHRPLLRAAAEHGLVVGLHAWGRVGNAPTSSGLTHTYLEDYLANSQTIVQAQVASLVTEGVFAELPDLRVTLLESGFSWLPTLLWRFDKDWKGVWREVPWLDSKPSDVVRGHIRLTTNPAHLPRQATQVRQALDLLDAKAMLLYSSDHPHDHGTGHDRLVAALTPDERDAIFAGNAAEWYRLG
ncbi:amidohydrolase family protein [Prauserella muralis]|uniref:Hydrolase n=1 Tax=Prauserella muralis TaxID=588067 RepID=A0A2V4AQ52_9PSEU|nr:amidohydrolase family protein [Prauserella muralis]PXY22144.1 hydrolase [Prauserella muralis]TWE27743.1 putative TIM-barrel fold metal-dependent hydrolase [Prauserella muralis]